MLSGEQRAIATAAIHQVLALASDFIKTSPTYEKYRRKEQESKGFDHKFTVAERDWDLEQRLKNSKITYFSLFSNSY